MCLQSKSDVLFSKLVISNLTNFTLKKGGLAMLASMIISVMVYCVYVFVVFALCFFLEEVNGSAWYVRVYEKHLSFPPNNPPDNKLDLACGFAILPIYFFLEALVGLFVGFMLFFISFDGP